MLAHESERPNHESIASIFFEGLGRRVDGVSQARVFRHTAHTSNGAKIRILKMCHRQLKSEGMSASPMGESGKKRQIYGAWV